MEKLFQKGVVVDLSNLVDYSAGGVVSKQIVKSAAGNITLFSFDKGEGLSEHTAPFDALVQILEGEMEIVVDGNHSRMKAGESLVLPANVPHALTAVQRFKIGIIQFTLELCKILIMCLVHPFFNTSKYL